MTLLVPRQSRTPPSQVPLTFEVPILIAKLTTIKAALLSDLVEDVHLNKTLHAVTDTVKRDDAGVAVSA